MSILIFLGASAVGGVLPFVAPRMRILNAIALILSTVVLGLGAYVGLQAFAGALPPGFWYLDPAVGLFVLIISFVQWTAVIVSAPYIAHEVEEGSVTFRHARIYFALLALFVLSMSVAVLSNNLGVVWIALEATTLTTTLLVAFYAKPGSLEAAWKYLILCSTGIALGLIGLLLAVYAASLAGIDSILAVQWTELYLAGTKLSPDIMKLAFIFVLIGYGTKAGLAPMHAWLPDAHSSAPAPISGLLSGVLLPVALFAVVRFKGIVDASLGDTHWTGMLMIIFGLISVLVSASFILVQQDYKRLLAYSSTEHIGLASIAFGLGGIATIAGVVHLAAHALIKSALFYGAGNIVARFKSTKFTSVGNVISVMPKTGVLFLIGCVMLLAAPPSPLFFSEYLLVLNGIVLYPYLIVLMLFGLTIVAAGFIRHLMPILFERTERDVEVRAGETFSFAHGATLMHYVFVALIGILLWTPGGFFLAAQIAAAFGK